MKDVTKKKHSKIFYKLFLFIVTICLCNNYLLAQDSTNDDDKIIKINTNFISAYIGGLHYPKQPSGTIYSDYADSSNYSSYEFESPTFGIGVGHDISKSLSLEFRYSSLGRLAIVNKVGSYANYFNGEQYQGYTFKSKDNKTTIDLSVLEFYLKWYYIHNNEFSLGLGAAPTYTILDVNLRDGDYKKSKQIQEGSFMLMPFAVTYRINNNFLISGSYHTIFEFEYGYIGLQYFFS